MIHNIEVLREVWRITERRGGATYKTEYMEDRWVSLDDSKGRPDGDPDLTFVVKSTSYEGKTIRTRKNGEEAT